MSNNVIKLIKKTQIFRDLLDKEVDKLLEGWSVLEVEKDQKVLTKGEKQKDLIVTLEGNVYLTRKDGTQVSLGPGSFFGELILLSDDIVATDIYAQSESVFVLVIPFDHIHDLYTKDLRIYGVVMANLAKMLAGRLKRAA